MIEEALYAFFYEVALYVERRFGAFKLGISPTGLARQQWILKICAMVKAHCHSYWVDWMTRKTMAQVDRQVAVIMRDWEEQEPTIAPPEFIEHEPDGSKAQDLLGGEMELRAPWLDQDSKG